MRIRILQNGGEGPQDFTRPTQTISELLPGKFTPGDLGIGECRSLLLDIYSMFSLFSFALLT